MLGVRGFSGALHWSALRMTAGVHTDWGKTAIFFGLGFFSVARLLRHAIVEPPAGPAAPSLSSIEERGWVL